MMIWSQLNDVAFRRNVEIVFVTGTFTPCIPQIAKDLNSTGAIVK